MTNRQKVVLLFFVICTTAALLVHSESVLGLTVGTFFSLAWHFRNG